MVFLPKDIVVWQAEEVPPDFHCRYDAGGSIIAIRCETVKSVCPLIACLFGILFRLSM